MFLARTSFILASDSRDADSLAVRAYSLTLFSSALALWPQASAQTQRYSFYTPVQAIRYCK